MLKKLYRARYLMRVENGELFGYCEAWASLPGFVEYDPDKHGYRSEVAAQMGLEPPPTVAQSVELPPAASTAPMSVAPEGLAPSVMLTEPETDLSDAFNEK